MNNDSIRCRGAFARSVLLSLALVTLGAPPAQARQALSFFKNYFVSGDYVAAGVGLRGKGIDGIASGTITIDPSQIPAGAEIVAAYLYWETLAPNSGPVASTLAGARFQRNDISRSAVLVNQGGSPGCTASGSDDHEGNEGDGANGSSVYVFRSDVLPYFERVTPSDPTKAVQVVVVGPHEVSLPDAGPGHRLPSTLGAGLVIVYRVAGYDATILPAYSSPKMPLKSIVIYDGGFTLSKTLPQLSLAMEGFYEASRGAPTAQLTQIVGNGRPGLSNTVQVTSTLAAADNQFVAAHPFVGGGGGGNPAGSTNTGIDVVTFPLPLEAGAMKAGISVTSNGNDNCGCLTFGAFVLSTVVQDRDGDGLLDVWEAKSEWSSKPPRLASVYSSWPLNEPTGETLPNLQAMGADPNVQDVFVQIDYMVGSGHKHLPTQPALRAIASAFHNAPPRPSLIAQGRCSPGAAAGQCPIQIHFDVGSNYQPAATVTASTCAAAASWTPDCAIIPLSSGTKSGVISETLCTAEGTLAASSPPAACAFPGYAGVVGWKNGERAYRDAPVEVATHDLVCAPGQTGCEPRMPRNRKDIFHYALMAHAIGYPSITNPLQPVANSGIADSNGGDLMITLGLWDNQVGSSFVQASTLMHELGHNFGLRHGGVLPSGRLEANCKPNYQSIMNYLFQVRGLWDNEGVPVIDYSRQLLPTLNESTLVETAGFSATSIYAARWYAPIGNSINAALGTSPASRHCDGTLVSPSEPSYITADGDPRNGAAIDWNADGVIAGTQMQNANFDGAIGETFTGANDYATMDLRQVGARRSVGSRALSYSVVDPVTGIAPAPPALPLGGGLSLDTQITDLGYGDLGYGDLGYGDLGYGDLGYGDLGYGDLGYGDLGYGDLGAPLYGPLSKGEPTPQVAASTGAGTPSSLSSTAISRSIQLNWAAPPAGTVLTYQLYRVAGSAVTPATLSNKVLVATLPGTSTQYVDILGQHGGDKSDECEHSSGSTYTYFIIATLSDPGKPGATLRSGASNFSTVVSRCEGERRKSE